MAPIISGVKRWSYEIGSFHAVAIFEPHHYDRDVPPRRHPANPQIGRAIEAARRNADLTQLEVIYRLRAVGVETSVSTLQRWETTGSIKLDDAVRLARALGVTVDTLAAPVLNAIAELPLPESWGKPDPDALAEAAAAHAAQREPPPRRNGRSRARRASGG